MAFRSVGINLPRLYLEDISDLTDDLEALKIAGPDFVEVGPHHLGVILGSTSSPSSNGPRLPREHARAR